MFIYEDDDSTTATDTTTTASRTVLDRFGEFTVVVETVDLKADSRVDGALDEARPQATTPKGAEQ